MDFTNKKIQNTYGGILNIGAVGASGSTLYQVTDGFGTILPIEISQTEVKFTGTVSGITGAGGGGATGATGTGGVIALYGAFYDTTTQTNAGANVGNPFRFNSTDFANGVNIVNQSEITFSFGGVFDLQFSAQFDKTDAGDDVVDVWLVKNGSVVANTNTKLTLYGNGAKAVAAWNFLVSANAGDKYEIYWHSTDLNMRLLAQPAATNPIRPAIPSIILTVAQVTYTQIGPTGAAGSAGTSGTSGSSGSAGTSGTSGSSGSAGTSGINGSDGSSGTSGANGSSGTSGVNGADGSSGTSGVNGSSGTSGVNGLDGSSGTSGVNGSSGTSGANGSSGTSGVNGLGYIGNVGGTSTIVAAGNTININPTLTVGNYAWAIGDTIRIGTSTTNYMIGRITAQGGGGTFWQVLILESYGSGSISNVLSASVPGSSGSSGISGSSGTSGINGADGTSGINGLDGSSGTSGENGSSGTSGTSGVDGLTIAGSSGTSGVSGSSGTSGVNGAIGPIGPTGPAGVAGLGLPSKAIILAGTSGWVGTGSTGSYYDVTFSSPFSSTDYVIDIQYSGAGAGQDPAIFYDLANPTDAGNLGNIKIYNKTVNGFRVANEVVNVLTAGYYYDYMYVTAISTGESAGSGTSGTSGSSGSSGETGATGDPGTLGVVGITGSYALQLTDAGKLIEVSSTSPVTITVPDNGGVPLPVGSNIMIVRAGTGEVGVTAGVGVTINSANGYQRLNVQYSSGSLVKAATDTWYLVGDLKL